MSNVQRHFRNDRTHKAPRARRAIAEALERRALFSTITWSNRATSDNFGIYGASANVARAIVDRAIGDWQNIISNFNYTGGGNTFSLSVTAAPLASGGRGVANILTRNDSTQKKPLSAAIQLDDNGGGGGWYFDASVGTAATPDDSEFDQLLTPFTADATGQTGNDFYRTIVHEIGHAVGITDDTNGFLKIFDFLSNGGADPNGGTLRAVNFNGGAIDYTLTSTGGGHMWEGGNAPGYTGPSHPNDLMNDGRTVAGGLTRRQVITDANAFLLRDVYGYSVNTPSQTNNLYASLNLANNQVIVRGLQGANSDVQSVSSFTIFGLTYLTFTVNGLTESTFAPSVNSLLLEGGGGTDFLRLENTSGKPVTMSGGDGDDFLDFAFVNRNLNNITGNTFVQGGNGHDQISIYDGNVTAPQVFTITSSRFDRSGWGGFSYAVDVEFESMITGQGNDVINVLSTYPGQPVLLDSAQGTDVVAIGNTTNGVRGIESSVTVNNAPSHSFVGINNGPDTTSRSVTAATSGVYGYIAGLAPATIFYKYNDVNSVSVQLGTGSDQVEILHALKPLTFTGSNGQQRNSFSIGNASEGTGGILADLRIIAQGFAANDIVVDNFGGGARVATLAKGAAGEYRLSGFTGAGVITYNRQGFNSGESLTLRGGFTNESLAVTNVDDPGAISFDGRGGFDSLSLDDRLLPNAPAISTFSATSLIRSGGSTGQIYSLYFANMDAIGFNAHASAITLNVTGVPESIPVGQQATVVLGNNNDVVNLYPHDAAGNLTINGNIGIIGSGGSDVFRIQDAAADNAIAYAFSNPFGAGTQNVYGLGLAGVGTAGIEAWEIYGGNGNDTFAMNQWTSGTSLGAYGGGGDDTFDFGNNNLPVQITSISSFGFDGQTGSDTFNLNNALASDTTSQWSYTNNASTLQASRLIGGGYNLTLSKANLESVVVNGIGGTDVMTVTAVPVGESLSFNGNDGTDAVNLPGDPSTVNAGIFFDAGAGTVGNINHLTNSSSAATTLHVDENSIGENPADNFFGAGGFMRFFNATAILLTLGSGEDTVFVHPNTLATLNIRGGSPTVAPGDTLNLALADVVSYVVGGTPPSGNVVSDSHKTLTYSGFEELNVDDVAPLALGGQFDFDTEVQQIVVPFSESVIPSVNVGYVLLTNTTTGETVSTLDMSFDYDPGTDTATIKFPSLTYGALADGDYHFTLAAGYRDSFGNASVDPLEFDFFVLAGDANRDRTVGFADLVTLAQNYGQTGKAFSEGDFDYDDTVGFSDLVILAQHYNGTLDVRSLAASFVDPVSREKALNRLGRRPSAIG